MAKPADSSALAAPLTNAVAPDGYAAQVSSAKETAPDFERITSLAHIYRCWCTTRRGKYGKDRVQRFDADALRHLSQIQQRLHNGTFRFGPYRYFEIMDKKRRDVIDSPMKDRVVHRFLYDYLTAIWQKRFIPDSYGNIKGKGTLRAVQRAAQFAAKPENAYALHLDISKFFYAAPHAHIKTAVLRHVGDQRIRDLLIQLIDSFQTDARYDHLFDVNSNYRKTSAKGMPLGNLTSQLFSNILLSDIDHHAKEELRLRHYIRYVDDFLVFGGDAAQMHRIAAALTDALAAIGLSVHPHKTIIRPVASGIPFLGFVIWPHHLSAGKRVREQYHRALQKKDVVNNADVLQSYRAWMAHTGATRSM